jgi:hypothetical protein
MLYFGEPSMNKKLLTPFEDFEIESYDEFINRYTGFGKELYLKISDELPDVFNELTFYKRINQQPKDSYALCLGGAYSFAIQLDPLCEVIVLWNELKHIEIGRWSENEYHDAINYMKLELMK